MNLRAYYRSDIMFFPSFFQREMQRDHQHIKELEIRNEHQQKILKRKTEEVRGI